MQALLSWLAQKRIERGNSCRIRNSHLPARDLAHIRLQIGFQRAARSQNRHPLRDVHMAADLFSARAECDT